MSYVVTWADWARRSDPSKYSEAIHPSGGNKREWFISGYLSAVDIYSLMGLPFGKSILEYGCGNGRILTHFKNHESYGVDITPQFVNEAKELGLQSFLLEEFGKKVDIVYDAKFGPDVGDTFLWQDIVIDFIDGVYLKEPS